MLAGAGDRAFCTGGDQSSHDGNCDGRDTFGLPTVDSAGFSRFDKMRCKYIFHEHRGPLPRESQTPCPCRSFQRLMPHKPRA